MRIAPTDNFNLPKKSEKETLSKSFYETNIILIPKLNKDYKKTMYQYPL